MKNCILIRSICIISLLLLLPGYKAIAQKYKPSAKGSRLEFTNKLHGTTKFKATFSDFSGDIIFDPTKLHDASFDIIIKTKSLQCGIPKVNTELKNNSIFNIAIYPVIKIKSELIFKDLPNSIIYQMHSQVTIKGITKPINIQFTATPEGKGYLFRGSFSVNRTSFGIGEKDDLDDTLTFFLELKADQAK